MGFGLGLAGTCTSNGAASGGRTMTLIRSPLDARLTVSATPGVGLESGFGPTTAAESARVTAKHAAADAAPRRLMRYGERERMLMPYQRAPGRFCSTGGSQGRIFVRDLMGDARP